MIKDVIVNLALNKSRDSVRDYAITVARTFDAHLAGVVFADGANLPVFLAPEFPSSLIADILAENRKAARSAVERFVLHWGDMGDEWGVNRSVSQIHGLLYLAEAPMTAEDIAETLGMARSNVSNSIKELLAWNLIRRVPILGDRRDHFEAETDIWEVAARIAAGRKEREIDPAVDALRACVSDAADDPTISPVAAKRLKEMLAFTELVDRWYTQMLNVPRPRLVALIKLGEKIVSFLPAGKSR